MSIGYFPSPKFVLPRGYIRSFSTRIDGIVGLSHMGSIVLAHYHVGLVETDFRYEIRDTVWQASRNAYSLDHILLSATYLNTDLGIYLDLPTNIGSWGLEFPPGLGIWVSEPDFGTGTVHTIDFPPMPSDYWNAIQPPAPAP